MQVTAQLQEAEEKARRAREEAEQLAREEAELEAEEQELQKTETVLLEQASSPRPLAPPDGGKRTDNVSSSSLQAQVAEAVQAAMKNILVRVCCFFFLFPLIIIFPLQSNPSMLASLIGVVQPPPAAASPTSFARQYEEELRQLRAVRERYEAEEKRRAEELDVRRKALEEEWRVLMETDRKRNGSRCSEFYDYYSLVIWCRGVAAAVAGTVEPRGTFLEHCE